MHRITFWMKAEPLTDPRSMRSERVKSEKVSYCKSYCCCTTADLAQNAHLALHRPVLCAPRPAPGCASPELHHATERRLAVAPGLLPTCGLPSLFTGMKRQTRTGSAPPPPAPTLRCYDLMAKRRPCARFPLHGLLLGSRAAPRRVQRASLRAHRGARRPPGRLPSPVGGEDSGRAR